MPYVKVGRNWKAPRSFCASWPKGIKRNQRGKAKGQPCGIASWNGYRPKKLVMYPGWRHMTKAQRRAAKGGMAMALMPVANHPRGSKRKDDFLVDEPFVEGRSRKRRMNS